MHVDYEVVRVIRNGCLLDAESYQRKYQCGAGDQLQVGWYIVARALGTGPGTYGAGATFHGPFGSRREAELDLEQMNAPGNSAAQPLKAALLPETAHSKRGKAGRL